MTTHSDLCKLAMIEITKAGGMPVLRPVGLFMDIRGNKRKIGRKGEADVQGVMPPNGKAVAVECKTDNDVLREDQQKWRAAFIKRGGVYFLLRGAAGVEHLARSLNAMVSSDCPD